MRIAPRSHNLGGGFVVRRLLPAAARQAVGPFVFFDHFGPVEAVPDDNHDVRAHPHIGLATVTYLFEGALLHRDSTGAVQRIEPGAVNWMTAGRGIVHCERTPDDLRDRQRVTHGLQLWVALPQADEEVEPAFNHVDAAALPQVTVQGATVRVLVGSAFGAESPVPARSPTLYLDVTLPPEGALHLPPLAAEQAVYSVDEPVRVDGAELGAHVLEVLDGRRTATLVAPRGARLVLVGGESLGARHIWWNFVSSRRERIAQAASDWDMRRFAAVPGETEFIPLPRRPDWFNPR
jgi:hypothetical protein